jgi:heat shock protein HtpX
MKNTLKTTILLGFLTGLFIAIGQLIGGDEGMVFALILAAGMNFFSYWFSDKLVLSFMRAKEVPEDEAPWLHSMVERLALSAGIPKPRIYIVPSPSPNAFATGRNPSHSAVAVTTGIIELLSREELEGVLAHEIAHIKNRDTLISAIAATIAGAIMVLANMAKWAIIFGGGRRDERNRGGELFLLFMVILAPLAATLIQLAISRSREYEADADGARIAGNPMGLARALQKLAYASQRIPMNISPHYSHLFIVNPLSAKDIFIRLFSTHPPIEERIRRLMAMKW